MGWIWEKNWDEKVVLPTDREPINIEANMYAALMRKIAERSEKGRSTKQSMANGTGSDPLDDGAGLKTSE